MGSIKLEQVALGYIRKHAEQARKQPPSSASASPLALTFLSNEAFTWSYKLRKTLSSPSCFGHGFITGIATPTKTNLTTK